MTLNEVLERLDKMFISRYGKSFAELNKNVYITAKNDKGAYEVPVVVVGKGGGTIKTDPETKLNPPAIVSIDQRNMKPQVTVYRLAIPYSECEIAARTPYYFNHLFDEIVSKGLGNYKITVGDENKVRFGTSYVGYAREDGRIFQQLEDSSIELRLSGEWSSDKEAYD